MILVTPSPEAKEVWITKISKALSEEKLYESQSSN